MSERRFYVSPEEFGERIRLGPDQSRYLSRVLRLDAEDVIRIFDGCGRECVYLVEKISKEGVFVRLVREAKPSAPESTLELTLAVPLLKKSNTELVLQKAVELGVNHFIPLICERSEVSRERWRPARAFKIAYESAKQCGRATLPTISDPLEFETFLGSHSGEGIVFYEEAGESLPKKLKEKTLVACTGPEGGWEKGEIEMAARAGFRIVHFGGRILKAETAAIIATAILQNKFGDLN